MKKLDDITKYADISPRCPDCSGKLLPTYLPEIEEWEWICSGCKRRFF